MRTIVIIGILITGLVLVGLFTSQVLRTGSPNEPVSSLNVLLKPGSIYTLRFDKPLPVSDEHASPPFKEWMPIYVDLIDVKPDYIRFRTMTLQEALDYIRHTEEKSAQMSLDLKNVDLDFIHSEYERGAPFGVDYFSWSPNQGNEQSSDESLLQILFSIETASRVSTAKKVKIGSGGLRIAPQLNKLGVNVFLIPENDNSLFVVPTAER
jgi:hypothetical protein